MITSVAFLNNAGRTKPGNLNSITLCLDNFHTKATDDEKKGALYLVFNECYRWLKENSSIIKTYSGTAQMAVENLRDHAIVELNALLPGLGDYTARKITAGPVKTTGLDTGYHLERSTYLTSGKTQAPFSMSVTHDNFNIWKQRKDNKAQFGKYPDPLKFNEGQFDTVGQQMGVRMYFLKKAERIKLMVRFAGNAWLDVTDTRANTRMVEPALGLGAFSNCQMYAMDRYGNLFVDYSNEGHGVLRLGQEVGIKAEKAAIAHRGQMNHSSFCAGKDILCAGMIFFWKGQLIHIDNASGHYKPTRDALYQAVKVLKEEGTDLGYLRVGVQGGDFFTARGFLKNKSRGDWPQQDIAVNQNLTFQQQGMVFM